MSQDPVLRWEWRAFAPAFDTLDCYTPADSRSGHDIYILSGCSNANVKIRDDTIDIKTCVRVEGGLELWQPVFLAAFPICQREVREVIRHLGIAMPEAYFEPEYSAVAFLADLIGASPDARVLGVHKICRQTELDGCVFERTVACVAGHTIQTVAIESSDPAAVHRLVQRLRLGDLENVNYVTFLKRMLGIRCNAAPACRTR